MQPAVISRRENAGNAGAALMAKLAPTSKVLILVWGRCSRSLEVYQSALTGESSCQQGPCRWWCLLSLDPFPRRDSSKLRSLALVYILFWLIWLTEPINQEGRFQCVLLGPSEEFDRYAHSHLRDDGNRHRKEIFVTGIALLAAIGGVSCYL